MKKIISIITALVNAIQAHASNEPSHRDMIAAVLMGEARGEGERGMRAIAEVIRNRGSDPVMVILRRRQFSCLNGMAIDDLVRRMRREKGWRTAQNIAEQLLKNPQGIGNETRGARFYERVGTKAWWTARFHKVATIGNHDFFRP